MNANQHLEHIKLILKKENNILLARAYLNEQDIDESTKNLLFSHAKVIVKNNKENRMAWTLVICLALSGVFIVATYFAITQQSTNEYDLLKLLDNLDIILFRVIPVGSILLSLIIAATLSEEDSYGMRFIKANVVTSLVCYILTFFVVLSGALG
ncbi:MAG: hypothetical protein ACPG41_08650 [Lacinutrix venerupis]